MALEGYLPRDKFRAGLEIGLARVSVMRKDWADGERRYYSVLERFPNSKFAPKAIYWRGVCRHKATTDHAALGDVAKILKDKYPQSVSALKSLPWLH